MTFSQTFLITTRGFCDVIDITEKVSSIVAEAKIKKGIAVVFATGSTAGITTIEMNANLEDDLREALEIIAPENKVYHHDEKWGDGNGFSHIRASLVGASLSVPIIDGELTLGTWQQLVLCDFDNRGRQREVRVQVVGE
jgi:secondary thiamine-phosphate synthase enzyme